MKMTMKQNCFIKCFLVSLLATSLLFFASPTEANAQELGEAQTDIFKGQTNGFELHVGLGYLAMLLEQTSDAHDEGSTSKEIITLHGINLTLSAGYRWNWIGVYLDQTLYTTFFIGGLTTIVGAKYFYKITDRLEFWGQSGIGLAYESPRILYFGESENNGWLGFALKLGGGLSYKVSKHVLVGADFNYTLGVNDDLRHLLVPSFHLRFHF